VKRTVLAIAAAAFLAAMLVPAALAADDGPLDPAEPTPVAEPTAPPAPTPGDGNGEIVIDPTFIAATPTPAGEVQGATSRPRTTPPPTDTITATTASGTGLQVLLVLGVAGSFLALLAARVPPVRRR
jgi:hypothetical protein